MLALAAFSSPARAVFWDDENLIDYNGNPTGYVLNIGEKTTDFSATYTRGFSDELTLGTNPALDLLLIGNFHFKYSLLKEENNKPALALDISAIRGFIMDTLSDEILKALSDYMDSLETNLYLYSVAFGISGNISPETYWHCSAGFEYGEFIWDYHIKDGQEDPFEGTGLEDVTGDYTGFYAAFGAERRLSRSLRWIVGAKFATASWDFSFGISLIWAASRTFRLELGLPPKINCYWRY